MDVARQQRCEKAIIDAVDAFIKTKDGDGVTSVELLRALWSIWHNLGEAFLKRNLIIN